MLEIPVIRWGQPYESMEKEPVVHFETGEALATVHQANGGLIKMDMRKANKARDILRQFSIEELCGMAAKAAELYMEADLPLGDGTQSPAEFCNMQSATTGLPEHMCAGNMRKNAFVLKHMQDVLEALTRGLPFDILSHGYGKESRDVMMSLSGEHQRRRHGAAFQLARRAYAVDARDSAADRTGPQARSAGTVDAVPHV